MNHNSTVADSEPTWSDVDKTSLPDNAFADSEGRRYPHHWVQGGGDPDDAGRYTTGEMFLHRGGLNAAWAAAQGAHTGEKADEAIQSHLQAHRSALGLDKEGNSTMETDGNLQFVFPPIHADMLSLVTAVDGHREFHNMPLLKAGKVLCADGSESRWIIPPDVAKAAIPLFDGAPMYLDHPGWFEEPSVKNLAGIVLEPTWNEEQQGIYATVSLYDDNRGSPGHQIGALLDQMSRDKANGKLVPELGLSALFFADSEIDEEAGLRITKAFRKVVSVDFVYSPGARAYVREALSAVHTGERPHHPERRNMDDKMVSITSGTATYAPLTGVQSPPPAAEPVAITQPHDDQTAQKLEALTAQIERLTALLAKKEEPSTVQGMGTAPRAPVTSGQMSTGIERLQSALDWMFGAPNVKPPEPELRRTDRLYQILTGDSEWRGIAQPDSLAAANLTTLADLSINAMNKVIVPLYDSLAHYRWFEQIVSVQPTDGTLQDMKWLQFGGVANLPVVADGAAYTELTVADSQEHSSFYKYGGYVGITEAMIRNSDIARMQAVPKALTVAAIRTRSAAIASLWTAPTTTGPTLHDDGTALFATNNAHSNYAVAALSDSAWEAARLECYKATELGSGKRLGFFPRFLLVPADLYKTALEIFGYGAGSGGKSGTADNTVNVYAVDRPGDPRPIILAVPEWTDVNNWGYVVDPTIAPVICMAYADSPGGRDHPAPQLFSVTSPLAGLQFTNDTLPIKVKDQWAYGVATYRGIGIRVVS